MDKKYLLILLALFLLIIISKRSKAAEAKPLPIPDENNLGTASTFYTVVKGDTLYKIARKFFPEEAGNPTKDKILNFARQNAIANGFDWGKYDDVPSSDLNDPDTLKPGQKLVVWTWGSFNENAPTTGALMPGQQANAFNSWEILI